MSRKSSATVLQSCGFALVSRNVDPVTNVRLHLMQEVGDQQSIITFDKAATARRWLSAQPDLSTDDWMAVELFMKIEEVKDEEVTSEL